MRPKKKKIMFVENDRYIVNIIKDLLEMNNFEVTLSSRSTEALEMIQSQPGNFDIVVSALNLLNLDGLELAKAIHNVKADMPFILCTRDNSIDEDEIKNLDIVKEIFVKPFSLVDFMKTIVTC